MSWEEETRQKEKGRVSRDWRQEMCNLEQLLEQLEHTSCKRQFKEGNYEIDKQSLEEQTQKSFLSKLSVRQP